MKLNQVRIILGLILSSVIFASNINDEVIRYRDKVMEDVKYGKNTASFTIGSTIVNMQPTYQGLDYLEINNDPIYLINFGLSLFPDSLDLSIGYSTILDNANSDTSEVEYTDIFLKPFKTAYGDFGFGYKKSSFKTTITNNSNYSDLGDGINLGGNTLTFMDIPGNDSMQDIKPGESFTTITDEIRFIIHYNIPSVVTYLPNGFGIEFSTFSGHKPWVSSYKLLELSANIEDGKRIDIGINKTNKEMIKGFNIKRLAIYSKSFKEEYHNYGLKEDESWSHDNLGCYIDVVYKNKFKLFSNDTIYLISSFVEVSTGETVQKESYNENGQFVEWVDSDVKKIETIMGLNFEVSYKF